MSAAPTTSLVKVPVGVLGAILAAYGLLGLAFGGTGFSTVDVPDGPVTGEEFLGIEGNGWTNVLWIGAGALLLVGAPLAAPARAAALIAGLALGAASVISLFTYWFDDHWGVFGILAANNWTTLAWGAVAIIALALALAPRRSGPRRDEAPTAPMGDDRTVDRRSLRFDRGRAEHREHSGRR